MKEIYKKWWFWLIILVIIGLVYGGQQKKQEKVDNSPYITKYEWTQEDVKYSEIIYDDGETEHPAYVVLGCENKDKDLQAGEYTVKTSGDDKASFIIYVTDKYYEDAKDLPEPYTDMVQGFNNSTADVKLNKGQYIYFVKGSTGTDAAKVIIEKK